MLLVDEGEADNKSSKSHCTLHTRVTFFEKQYNISFQNFPISLSLYILFNLCQQTQSQIGQKRNKKHIIYLKWGEDGYIFFSREKKESSEF